MAQGADPTGLGAEVANLKVADVSSKRMLPRVEQGIGRKERFAKLPERLFELLRDWEVRALKRTEGSFTQSLPPRREAAANCRSGCRR